MRLTDKKKNILKERVFIYSIIAIPLISFVIFYIGINGGSILMAFQLRKIDPVTMQQETEWTFANFVRLWEDLTRGETSQLLLCTRNTFIFFLLGQVCFPISFVTSYFLWKKVPLSGVYRILFFIPSILSSVVWSNIYKEIVGQNGPFNDLYLWITGTDYPIDFLIHNDYALPAVIGYSLWFSLTGNFVLYSGTLTRIPKELEEAGQLEGITWFQELIHVVVPLVWPTVSTVWLMGLMGLFGASGNILLLTGGAYNTNTLSYFLFDSVYHADKLSNSFNYASAVGIVMTLLTLPIVFVVQRLLEKVPPAEF